MHNYNYNHSNNTVHYHLCLFVCLLVSLETRSNEQIIILWCRSIFAIVLMNYSSNFNRKQRSCSRLKIFKFHYYYSNKWLAQL